MSAGWTPGPHTVVEAEHLGDRAYAVSADDGDLIAVGCLKGDALLFAAAPELYEALEKCVGKLRKALTHAGNADFAVDACCEQFEAALAKATPLANAGVVS